MARILVVDDDADVIDACRTILEAEGHEIDTAQDRQGGMNAIASFSPNLVVLDVMMDEPDDGIAMAQELRRQGFDKPILMMSSISKVTGMEYSKDSEILPVDEFLEKPVKPQTLIDTVKRLLDN